MNILFVTNMYPNTDNLGAGTFVMHQAEYLKKLGHSVNILHILGYRSKFNYLKAVFDVFLETKKKKYDIVHAHYGLSGLPALFSWKTPVLVTLHGSDILVGIIQPMISHFVCKFSDGVITVSQKINSIINGYVIPCGVDLEVFKPYSQVESRYKLGLPLDKKIIIFPFDPQIKIKRYDLAEKVIKKLKANGLKIDLLIVNKVSNDQMPIYYSASDAMILCSDSEGSPTSVKEALACNIPVISTNVGDVEEIMKDIPGTAICNSSIDSLAENLLFVLEYKKRNKFNGRSFIERYSQNNTILTLIEVYKNIINKNKKCL